MEADDINTLYFVLQFKMPDGSKGGALMYVIFDGKVQRYEMDTLQYYKAIELECSSYGNDVSPSKLTALGLAEACEMLGMGTFKCS